MKNPHIDTYIKQLNEQFSTGNATEHSYRGPLQALLSALLPSSITVINEPKRSDCGAPDYILMNKNQTPVAYLEAKNFMVTSDLDGLKENKEQFDRYKKSLRCIVFTDYLDFHLYEDGEYNEEASIRIAEQKGNKIVGLEENEERFLALIEHIGKAIPKKITSPTKLANLMAAKARLLASTLIKVMEQEDEYGYFTGQLNAFKMVLIDDLEPNSFADIYAQTITYGMFAARLHDETPDDFTRQEAATLIPHSNPFLRQMFQGIAGYDLDERIAWIIDDLAEIFRVSDVQKIMQNYGSSTMKTDPIVHFYEDFLAAYDPKLRKSRGVWYTPQPVVDFIVRAIDDILQDDFGLPMGLADTSKTMVKIANTQKTKKDKVKEDTYSIPLHKVQILDPATGTGTFLASVIKKIYEKMQGQQGIWQGYVEDNIIPRINGFEILMASYAMAHLKMDLLLQQTGYKATSGNRFKIYLTNSLESYHEEAGTLWAQMLAQEAAGADSVKRDSPVMIVTGNPPYSISSSNSGKYAVSLVEKYKKDLNERNIQPLSDDYIKFIALGQSYIEKNGEGILAYITNNGYLDGLIHRQMRKSLLETFDKIYILNLHGNSRKKETAPDGSKDENVFDIMQGVAIAVYVKTGKKAQDELAKVYYSDIYGERESKYQTLDEHSIGNIDWQEISYQAPEYFFIPKDYGAKKDFDNGFGVNELFPVNTSGVTTHHDDTLVSITPFSTETNQFYAYRPFDNRYVDYNINKVVRHRFGVMKHMINTKNIGLITTRSNRQISLGYVYIVDKLVDRHILDSAADATYLFPLYLKQENLDGSTNMVLNFNQEILSKIEAGLGEEVEPQELFDYIYGVLHIPSYRGKYKEFLKIDFPRIPYPTNASTYHEIAKYGKELRVMHLMKKYLAPITQYNIPGNNFVAGVQIQHADKEGYIKVYINKEQYFDNVPETAWNFFIGGYQPLQKWLKDRKNRTLASDDVSHWQQVVCILMETDRIMKELDEKYGSTI